MTANGAVSERPTLSLPPVSVKRRLPRLRLVTQAGAALLVLGLVAEVVWVFFGSNFHTVIPKRVYRCAQPSGAGLGSLIQRHDIRTVVNLRGYSAPVDWYMDESRVTARQDLAQEDICFSAGRLPGIHEIRHLVEVLDRTESPILIHCKQGADRTGMASALALLLLTDTSLEQARGQLDLRYGHVALGRPAYLDYFFDLYAEWLAAHELRHSPLALRRWLEQDYCPDACACRVEALELPPCLPCGRPAGVRFRFHNTSIRTWRLRPESTAGIHASFWLYDGRRRELAKGRSGLFDAEVGPGQSIDLTLALPVVREPGTYLLVVDMVDERQCMFFQSGSEPLEQELEFRE